VYEVEKRLYDVTPTFATLVYDFSELTFSVDQQNRYGDLNQQQFKSYLSDNNIVGAFANVTYNPSNAFTWNYLNCIITTPPRSGVVTSASCWQQLYTNWFGTPYPHLEPWKLAGFTDKPAAWDATYADPTLTRRWTTTMWSDIMSGTVVGSTGIVYAYVPVNTTSLTIAGGYKPDDLLPPYYNTASSQRSLFTNLSTEIVAPAAGYAYGDSGPVEWSWSVSGFHVYDPSLIAIKMQPVRFMHYSFGVQFTRANNLQIATERCKVYSHRDVMFHGDIFDSNTIYLSRGINQWYVNYNRYCGYDTNRDFRSLWALWSPKMTYQMSGIIDTDTFDITNKFFDIVPQDYNIVLANAGIIDDMWVDGFEISLLSVPPSLMQHNNESAWKMELDTLSPSARSLSYYGVRNYPYVVDVVNNVATIYRYNIVDILSESRTIDVIGDHVDDFQPSTSVVVSGVVGNDGTYTVQSSAYNIATNTTRITTVEVPPLSTVGGVVDIPSKVLPWETGQVLYLASSQQMPSPVVAQQDYYFIKLNDRQFRLAESVAEASSNTPLVFLTPGTGTLTVGQVNSSYYVFGGASVSQQLWYHFVLDKNIVHTITPPFSLSGIQRLGNLVDGYIAYQNDRNIVYNLPAARELDPDTNRSLSWQVETERFIDWAYRFRNTGTIITDRYEYTVEGTLPTSIKFTAMVPSWTSNVPVSFTTSGSLPAPLLPNVQYYLIATGTPGVYTVSVAQTASSLSTVSLTSTGSGTLWVSQYAPTTTFPSFEMNPSRNNIWIDTPRGVVSNVVDGPYPDIRVKQTIFDQYGRPITADKLLVFRQDKQTRIQIMDQIANDQVPPSIASSDPYAYIHVGGAHLFVEGYEHVLLLNDYTVTGDLMYDQFIGLNSPRFNVDYYEKTDYSMRPTLGGYYLIGNEFKRNMEGQTTDMSLYYDAFGLPENSPVAKYARALVGYTGRMNFLDLINVNSKSQFIFYRGMVQQKGSINSVNAYINSRRFLDAQVDEFWAWKVAEFGDSRPKVYPQIKLYATDANLPTIKLEFKASYCDGAVCVLIHL